MKKVLVLLFISLFLVSCWGDKNETIEDTSSQEVQDNIVDNTQKVQVDVDETVSDSELTHEENILLDSLLESYESESSNQTEEENLDELIDILFDTTY